MIGRASTVRSVESQARAKRRRSWRVAETLQKSFGFATTGILHATSTQRNFRIHLAMGTLALGFGALLHVTLLELAIVGLTIAMVLALELVNTAIEAAVDLTIGEQYHPLAAIAKDCAAGAVLVAAFTSLFVACCILLPPLSHAVFLATGHP
jgi:diacylglycerol kinase (ATP)